jgi:hypothetical protein
MTDLDRLATLAKAATPGPWRWWHERGSSWTPRDGKPPSRLSSDHYMHGGVLDHRYPEILTPDDAAYIAALDPTTVLDLIAMAREAERLREALEVAADRLETMPDYPPEAVRQAAYFGSEDARDALAQPTGADRG